jgi:translation initiation factor IF-3
LPDAAAGADLHPAERTALRRSRRKTAVPPRPRVTARVNEQITATEIRVVGEDGNQIGVMSRGDALRHARELGTDLVEVAPDGRPPVCRLTDYGRWRYAEERRLRAGRRSPTQTAPKEVRLRPWIAPHDYTWKRDRAVELLRGRRRVKLIVFFRGRERERPEAGRELIARLLEDLRDVGRADGRETLEGRTMTVVVVPTTGGDS